MRKQRGKARRRKKSKKRKRKAEFNEFKRTHKIKRGLNWHHLENFCHGGEGTLQNLLRIDIEKHQIWHHLFHNLNLDEVIALLKRLKRAKSNQREVENE